MNQIKTIRLPYISYNNLKTKLKTRSLKFSFSENINKLFEWKSLFGYEV